LESDFWEWDEDEVKELLQQHGCTWDNSNGYIKIAFPNGKENKIFTYWWEVVDYLEQPGDEHDIQPVKNSIDNDKLNTQDVRKGSFVEHELESIDRVKKRQLSILIGDHNDELIETMSEYIQQAIKDKYDLSIRSSFDGKEILELAEKGAVDIFILTLNNIRYGPDIGPIELLTQIKTTYRRPVIAASGFSVNAPLIVKVKQIADFYFLRPFNLRELMKAIEKCMDMLPEFNESKEE
jgi:hypothetical protein